MFHCGRVTYTNMESPSGSLPNNDCVTRPEPQPRGIFVAQY